MSFIFIFLAVWQFFFPLVSVLLFCCQVSVCYHSFVWWRENTRACTNAVNTGRPELLLVTQSWEETFQLPYFEVIWKLNCILSSSWGFWFLVMTFIKAYIKILLHTCCPKFPKLLTTNSLYSFFALLSVALCPEHSGYHRLVGFILFIFFLKNLPFWGRA